MLLVALISLLLGWQSITAYMLEVGFGAEYRNVQPVLHRWDEDIRIRVHGTPTQADRDTLHVVVNELNDLIPTIDLTLDSQNSNVDIYFVPQSRFAEISPEYVPENMGFFSVWWNDDDTIYKGRILISSQGVTQQERSHIIREELTQSLGLFKDSWRYEDSIFYQGWTDTTEYSALDREVIKLFYTLRPGLTLESLR